LKNKFGIKSTRQDRTKHKLSAPKDQNMNREASQNSGRSANSGNLQSKMIQPTL